MKWHLSDTNGNVVNPASFVTLHTYSVSCFDFTGDPWDAMTESSPGSSGLRSTGKGNWNFDWKIPKTYAVTYRNINIAFDSGYNFPEISFKFK